MLLSGGTGTFSLLQTSVRFLLPRQALKAWLSYTVSVRQQPGMRGDAGRFTLYLISRANNTEHAEEDAAHFFYWQNLYTLGQ